MISRRFGWFWECPNGDNCQYRHALPPGFMLKSQRKALEEAEKANTISLEEFLEVEVSIQFLRHRRSSRRCQRHKLGTNLTPVTPETFAKWKRTRMDKKQAEEEAMHKAKETQAAAGKNSGMSGRDLVSGSFVCPCRLRSHLPVSSHTTLSGSKIPTKRKRKIGTCRSIVGAMVHMRGSLRRARKTWTSRTAVRVAAIKPSYKLFRTVAYCVSTTHSLCALLWTVVYASRTPHMYAYYITIHVYEYIVHHKFSLVIAPVVR